MTLFFITPGKSRSIGLALVLMSVLLPGTLMAEDPQLQFTRVSTKNSIVDIGAWSAERGVCPGLRHLRSFLRMVYPAGRNHGSLPL
jgi:hypothetical protein